jgi:hypothetical protein
VIDEPLGNVLGPLVMELREATPMAAVVGLDDRGIRRIRGFEPKAGDAQPAEKYIPFVVLSLLDATPDPDIPVTFAIVGFRCYGATAQGAWEIYAALVQSLHRQGPRTAGPIGIYQSLVISGGTQDKEPDTKQPLVRGSIELLATAQAFAA